MIELKSLYNEHKSGSIEMRYVVLPEPPLLSLAANYLSNLRAVHDEVYLRLLDVMASRPVASIWDLRW